LVVFVVVVVVVVTAGFGGYVCCSKIDHGKCSEKNMCDNSKGQFFNDRTMKCECRTGFVLVGDECHFELTRQVHPKMYEEEYDYEQYQFPEYENDGAAPMMRSAFVNQDPAAQPVVIDEVSSTTQRVTTKSDKKSKDQNEEALDLCFGKGCDDKASVQVGKKKKNKSDRLANRLGLSSTERETSTESSASPTTEQATSPMSSTTTSTTTTTTTTTKTTKEQMKLEVVDASGPVVKMKPNLKMASETGPLPPAVLEKLRQMQLMDPTTTMYPETTQYYTEFPPLQADTDIYAPMSRQFGFVGSLPVEDSLDDSSSEDSSSNDSAPIAGALPFDQPRVTQVVTSTTTTPAVTTTTAAVTTSTTKAAITTTQSTVTVKTTTTTPVTTSTTKAATTTTKLTTTTTQKITTTTTPAPITTTTTIPITTTTTLVADEWSTWGTCSAACGNGEEKRTKGTQVETRKCHIKFCGREVWLLSMLMPSDALLPILHAGESGDTFLLKLMLYQNDIETIFAYAMQANNPADETPTDVVNQFIRFKMFYQASMPAQGQAASGNDQIQSSLMPLIFLKSAAAGDEAPEQQLDQGKIDYLVNAVKMDNVINNVQS
jgi:hypothetical protein